MCICITSSIPSSLTTFTQWNDLQWKVAFLWGLCWVLHIPSCPLRGEGFEAFFSNLSVVFTSFLQHFNDWCVIKANRKQNKRCTSSKLFDYFPPLPLQLIKLHWVRKEKSNFRSFPVFRKLLPRPWSWNSKSFLPTVKFSQPFSTLSIRWVYMLKVHPRCAFFCHGIHLQDWGSYMKGAWVLRRAWKIYQKTYSDIRRLYIKRVGLGNSNSIGKYESFLSLMGNPSLYLSFLKMHSILIPSKVPKFWDCLPA